MALTPEEKTRRAVALSVAETERAANGVAHQLERAAGPTLLVEPACNAGRRQAGFENDDQPLPAGEPLPPPHITITISGAPHSGKSVTAHLIRAALAREGIVASGPEGLQSIPWHRALHQLIGRGLSIALVEIDSGSDPGELAWELKWKLGARGLARGDLP